MPKNTDVGVRASPHAAAAAQPHPEPFAPLDRLLDRVGPSYGSPWVAWA